MKSKNIEQEPRAAFISYNVQKPAVCSYIETIDKGLSRLKPKPNNFFVGLLFCYFFGAFLAQ